jgi:hypothetical protein
MREAVAPLPTTFRLVPRPYQYEAVAALLAATARGGSSWCPWERVRLQDARFLAHNGL